MQLVNRKLPTGPSLDRHPRLQARRQGPYHKGSYINIIEVLNTFTSFDYDNKLRFQPLGPYNEPSVTAAALPKLYRPFNNQPNKNDYSATRQHKFRSDLNIY